jgi:hypothetical protein
MMVSINVLTPSIALGSNGWRSEPSPVLGSLLAGHRFTTPKDQYLYTLICVPVIAKNTTY